LVEEDSFRRSEESNRRWFWRQRRAWDRIVVRLGCLRQGTGACSCELSNSGQWSNALSQAQPRCSEQKDGGEAERGAKFGVCHRHRQVRVTAHCNPLLEATIAERVNGETELDRTLFFLCRDVAVPYSNRVLARKNPFPALRRP
jgi:hypothetical protein